MIHSYYQNVVILVHALQSCEQLIRNHYQCSENAQCPTSIMSPIPSTWTLLATIVLNNKLNPPSSYLTSLNTMYCGVSLSHAEWTIYELIFPHSPSDITKARGRRITWTHFEVHWKQFCAIGIRVIGVSQFVSARILEIRCSCITIASCLWIKAVAYHKFHTCGKTVCRVREHI